MPQESFFHGALGIELRLNFTHSTYQTRSLVLCKLFLMCGKNPLALRRAQFDSFHSLVPTVYTDPLWAATLYPDRVRSRSFPMVFHFENQVTCLGWAT